MSFWPENRTFYDYVALHRKVIASFINVWLDDTFGKAPPIFFKEPPFPKATTGHWQESMLLAILHIFCYCPLCLLLVQVNTYLFLFRCSEIKKTSAFRRKLWKMFCSAKLLVEVEDDCCIVWDYITLCHYINWPPRIVVNCDSRLK